MQLCTKLCDMADKLPMGSNEIQCKGMSTVRSLSIYGFLAWFPKGNPWDANLRSVRDH